MKAAVLVLNVFLLSSTFWFLVKPTIILAQNSGNREVNCASDVVVQAEDWLSKIADKYFGDVLAFPAIVEVTNAKAAFDSTYTVIQNPNIIELGWKLCIPNAKEAQAILDRVNVATISPDDVNTALVPVPKLVEFNTADQFVWEWEGAEGIKNLDWYFDIKIYDSPNAATPYNTLVADPEKTDYYEGKWYFHSPKKLTRCSYWVVQIAKRESGKFVGWVSAENERLKAGPCGGESTFSSPVN